MTSVARLKRNRGELLTGRTPRGGLVTSGVVHTKLGIVEAYSWTGRRRQGNTWLAFISRGRVYRLRENRGHTQVGIAILAGRFVRDVVAGRIR